MAKRQHFTNSKVGTNLFEPIYGNLFEVTITPPDILAQDPDWGAGRELIIEEIKSINGLTVDKIPTIVTQKFKGTDRNFIGVIPDTTSVKPTIEFEMNLNNENQNFLYKALRKWSDLCYNPLTGAQTLKKDYVSQTGMTIVAFNKEFDVHRKWEIKNIFPALPIKDFDFNYETNTPLTMQMQFVGDYFGNAYK